MTYEIGKRWNSSEVQSLLMDRDYFTKSAAKKWARRHGFRYGKVHTTGRYHRLRQYSPKGEGPFRTITFAEGIKAIVGPNEGSGVVGNGRNPVALDRISPGRYAYGDLDIFYREKEGWITDRGKGEIGPFGTLHDVRTHLERVQKMGRGVRKRLKAKGYY